MGTMVTAEQRRWQMNTDMQCKVAVVSQALLHSTSVQLPESLRQQALVHFISYRPWSAEASSTSHDEHSA